MRRPEHRCPRQHRSYRALAKCLWPKAIWIEGEGPHASVTWCGGITVQLHETACDLWSCLAAGQFCGARCKGIHGHVKLYLPMSKRVAA